MKWNAKNMKSKIVRITQNINRKSILYRLTLPIFWRSQRLELTIDPKLDCFNSLIWSNISKKSNIKTLQWRKFLSAFCGTKWITKILSWIYHWVLTPTVWIKGTQWDLINTYYLSLLLLPFRLDLWHNNTLVCFL